MPWMVELTAKVIKARRKLPRGVDAALGLLMAEMELNGPVRGNWANYGKLSPGRHHCHLKKGQPTYVAVWEESGRGIRLIEVTYVGTHGKAPY